MNTDVSVNFILEGTKPNKENKYPIKLNIYQKEVGQKRYGIKESVTKDEWEKLFSTKLKDKALQQLRTRLDGVKRKVTKITDDLNPFSFVAFEEKYFSKSASGEKSKSLKVWFENYINALKENDQIGTAISYNTTLNSLQAYRKNLSLYDITPKFLAAYDAHLMGEGKSTTTVGIYMRQLRAIINQAIKDNAMKADVYPFKAYQIPTGKNIKKALSFADLNKLLEYQPENLDQQKALKYWLLSYLCSGINFTDIAHLKPSNLQGDYLHFIREKTKRTKKKDVKPIAVGLNEKAKQLIKELKNANPENPYLFPILEAGLSAKTIKYRCQNLIKFVNKHMEAIAVKLDIDQKVGTYAARHSFSTVLKRKGASTSFIKEALGHSSEAITESYLDSFTDDVKLDYANLLTNL